MIKSSRVDNSLLNSSVSSNLSANRKTLLERLAALRIQSEPSKIVNSNDKITTKSESPRYIPRNNQIIANQSATNLTKSKFYAHSKASDINADTGNIRFKDNNFCDDNDDFNPPSSPTIGRRRRLATELANAKNFNINSNIRENRDNSKNIKNTKNSNQTSSPIGISSPKYFQKQKILNLEMNSSSNPVFQVTSPIQTLDLNDESIEKHNVKDIVSSFINSFTILHNFLIKSNVPAAKIQLQNMYEAFAALQMDLKEAFNATSFLKSANEKYEAEIKVFEIEMTRISNRKIEELEEQLKISLSHVSEITLSLNKEKSNVEFLQNYMEEVLQLKDEGEKQTFQLLKRISELEADNEIIIKSADRNDSETDQEIYSEIRSQDLNEENKKLKETIKLLELERFSTKNVCEQAIQVLDLQNSSNPQASPSYNSEHFQLELNQIRQELKQKQIEIDKLQGREKHFKESNEIFQQKLLILTEENRKLKGQRPINHY